jgi:hypothetical protein
MSILLYNYKQLTECISEVERIEARLNSSKKKNEELAMKEEEEKQEKVADLPQPSSPPTTATAKIIRILKVSE